MIKRLVILQDEQIAFAEIERSMRRAAAPAPAAVGRRPSSAAPARASRRRPAWVFPTACLPIPMDQPDGDGRQRTARPNRPMPSGGSLATVARAAAMKAERALIEKTLTQVHWNRRKASQILGVSYKTLLNKIKECSITRD